MVYVALDNFQKHVERVRRRAILGGHAASESTLRRIYESSLKNLPTTLNPEESGIDTVRIFDNSAFQTVPRLCLSAERGRVVGITKDFPLWLMPALHWTDADLEKIRKGESRPGPLGPLS